MGDVFTVTGVTVGNIFGLVDCTTTEEKLKKESAIHERFTCDAIILSVL